METRYILPATVAASLHLIAFFGYNPTRVPKPPVDRDTFVCTLEPIPFNLEETPPDPDDTPDEMAAQPKGRPDVARPGLDEPAASVGPVTMERPPAAPLPTTYSPTILPGVFGSLDGTDAPGAGGPILNFTGLDNTPHTRSQVAPVYPGELKTAGITGEVLVTFVVDESGRVSHARVVRSTDSRFEAATLRAVERWRFEPGKKNGRTVRFRMEVPVMFNLAE